MKLSLSSRGIKHSAVSSVCEFDQNQAKQTYLLALFCLGQAKQNNFQDKELINKILELCFIAARQNPKDPDPFNTIAYILLIHQAPKQAIPYLEHAKSLAPSYTETILLLAQAQKESTLNKNQALDGLYQKRQEGRDHKQVSSKLDLSQQLSQQNSIITELTTKLNQLDRQLARNLSPVHKKKMYQDKQSLQKQLKQNKQMYAQLLIEYRHDRLLELFKSFSQDTPIEEEVLLSHIQVIKKLYQSSLSAPHAKLAICLAPYLHALDNLPQNPSLKPPHLSDKSQLPEPYSDNLQEEIIVLLKIYKHFSTALMNQQLSLSKETIQLDSNLLDGLQKSLEVIDTEIQQTYQKLNTCEDARVLMRLKEDSTSYFIKLCDSIADQLDEVEEQGLNVEEQSEFYEELVEKINQLTKDFEKQLIVLSMSM